MGEKRTIHQLQPPPPLQKKTPNTKSQERGAIGTFQGSVLIHEILTTISPRRCSFKMLLDIHKKKVYY